MHEARFLNSVLLFQELLSEETRQKLNLSGRLRQMEDDRNGLMEQLEEETEVKRAVERQVSSLNMQVSSAPGLRSNRFKGQLGFFHLSSSSLTPKFSFF